MASGDTLVIWSALHNEPRSVTSATLDTRNQHPVLDFDATTQEYTRFSSVMPQAYDSGGLTVYYHVAFSSATAGTAALAGAFERIGDRLLDIDSDSFATAKNANIGAPGTAGIVVVGSCTFGHGAGIDNLLTGEGFRCEIYRDVGTAADNASGDLELRFVEIRET